jgi:hypothetical protein
MPEALVPTSEAIDRLLGSIRVRLEAALRNGQRVQVHARAGMKRQVWQPGVDIKPEEDGSFSLSLEIEARK